MKNKSIIGYDYVIALCKLDDAIAKRHYENKTYKYAKVKE